jgi:hypothetical protein
LLDGRAKDNAVLLDWPVVFAPDGGPPTIEQVKRAIVAANRAEVVWSGPGRYGGHRLWIRFPSHVPSMDPRECDFVILAGVRPGGKMCRITDKGPKILLPAEGTVGTIKRPEVSDDEVVRHIETVIIPDAERRRALTGKPPKRTELIRACTESTRALRGQVVRLLRAHLPAHLRRSRGERDRSAGRAGARG